MGGGVVCGVDSVDSGASSSSPELHILGRAGQGWSQPPVLIISGPMLPHTSLLTDQALRGYNEVTVRLGDNINVILMSPSASDTTTRIMECALIISS